MGETVQCTSGKFGCLTPHGKYECLTKNFMCDGHVDCKENFDERHCTKCSKTLWSCHDHTADGKLECISKDWVCDGTADCYDGSDEQVCNNKRTIAENTTDVAVAKRRIEVQKVQVSQTTKHPTEKQTTTEHNETTGGVSNVDKTTPTPKNATATRIKKPMYAKNILRLPVTTGPIITLGQVSQRSHEELDDFKTLLTSQLGVAFMAVVAVLVSVILIAVTVIIARHRKSTKRAKKRSTKAIDTTRDDTCYASMNYLVAGDRVENNEYEDIEDFKREMLSRRDYGKNDAEFNNNCMTNQYQAIQKMPTKPYAEYSSLNEQLQDSGASDTIVLHEPITSGKRNSAYAAVSTLPRDDVLPYETPITLRFTMNDTANNTGKANSEQNNDENYGNTCRGKLESGEYDICTFETSQIGSGEKSPNDYLNPVNISTSQTSDITQPNDYLHPINSK